MELNNSPWPQLNHVVKNLLAFSQMMLGKPEIHMQTNEITPIAYPMYEN
jgi:hypothetical protein